jgi:hypothetical protein
MQAASGAGCMLAMWLGVLHVTRVFTLTHLNSDLLFLVELHRQLFVAPVEVSHWHLPGVLSLFPEMPILFPLLSAGTGLGPALFLYGAIFASLMVLVTWLLLCELSGDPWRSFTLSTLTGLVLVASLVGADSPLPVFLWPSYHGGTILAGLALLTITLRAHRLGWSRGLCVAFVAVLAPSALSDQFVVLQFVLPLMAAGWLARRRGLVSPATLRTTLAMVAVAGALVLAVVKATYLLSHLDLNMNAAFRLVDWLVAPKMVGVLLVAVGVGALLVRRRPPWQLLAASGLVATVGLGLLGCVASASVRTGASWLGEHAAGASFTLGRLALANPALLVLAVLAIGACGWLSLVVRDPRATAHLVPLLVLVIEATFVGVVAGWDGLGNVRYAQPLYVLPPIVLACVASMAQAHIPELVRRVGITLALGFGLLRVLTPLCAAQPLAAQLATPYPSELRCLDAERAHHDLHDGYADYWATRQYNLLSHHGPSLHALNTTTLAIDPIISNPATLRSPDGTPVRTDWALVLRQPLADNGVGTFHSLDRATLLDRVGPPAARELCGNLELWIYDRPTDTRFRALVTATPR